MNIDYAIVSGATPQEITDQVGQMLATGFVPIGGLAAVTVPDEANPLVPNLLLFQAVVRQGKVQQFRNEPRKTQ